MSWSFKVTGRPSEIVNKASNATTVSYSRSVGDQQNLNRVLLRLNEDAVFYGSNGVPTTFIEAEGFGHWDDTSGSGNYSLKITVLNDRRKP